MRCNHDAEWDDLIHIAKMANNIFYHSAAGESPFFLMYGRDANPAPTPTTQNAISGR